MMITTVLLLAVALAIVSEEAEATELKWTYDDSESSDHVVPVISENGDFIATIHNGGTDYLYLFSSDSLTHLWKHPFPSNTCFYYHAISSDGNYVAVGCTNKDTSDTGYIYLFENGESDPIWTYETEGRVASLAFSNEDHAPHYLVSGIYGSTTKDIILFADGGDGWGSGDKNPVRFYDTDDSIAWHSGISISSDGTYIAACDDTKVYLFSKESDSRIRVWDTEYNASSVDMSSDGQFIVVSDEDPFSNLQMKNYKSLYPFIGVVKPCDR